LSHIYEGRGKKEEGRRKKEEGRGKKEEGRRKREERVLAIKNVLSVGHGCHNCDRPI